MAEALALTPQSMFEMASESAKPLLRTAAATRRPRREGALLREAQRGSSEAQRIAGPVLYVPWTRRSTETVTTVDDGGRSRSTSREKIERGQVALSRDLAAALSLAAVTIGRGWFGMRMLGAVSERLMASLGHLGDHARGIVEPTAVAGLMWSELRP